MEFEEVSFLRLDLRVLFVKTTPKKEKGETTLVLSPASSRDFLYLRSPREELPAKVFTI
jgi:hypothetical protein